MTPRQQLEEKVGKENAAKWIEMVQNSIKPQQEVAASKE